MPCSPHTQLSLPGPGSARSWLYTSWSRRMLTDRWGSDCWCQRTCSAMQLKLVIDTAQGRAIQSTTAWSLPHTADNSSAQGVSPAPGCEHGFGHVMIMSQSHTTTSIPQASTHIVFTIGAFQPRLRRRRQTAHSRPCHPRGRDLLGGRQDGVFRRYAGTRTEITVSSLAAHNALK